MAKARSKGALAGSSPSQSGTAAKRAAEAEMAALDWLQQAELQSLPSIFAAVGPDAFLQRQAIRHLEQLAKLGEESMRAFDCDEAAWADVRDYLATLSLFEPEHQRLAVLRQADKFVSRYRAELQRWLAAPPHQATLVIELSSLPSNQKLHAAVVAAGMLVKCEAPAGKRLEKWLSQRAQRHHRLRLSELQAGLVIDRMGSDLDMLDTELAKLAMLADDDGQIAQSQLEATVGGWRVQTAWQVAEAAVSGRTAEALQELDKLLLAGQAAIGLLAQLSWYWRRFGVAAELIAQGERCGRSVTLGQALLKAGFRPYDVESATRQLRRIGRPRALQLLRRLLEADQQLKGSHSQEARSRWVLEQLILWLGLPAVAERTGG
jgi:DNA polymerase III subunit delta